jgi:hypothetical protein
MWVAFFLSLVLLLFLFQCGQKDKPTNPELKNPSYYFPINFYYQWTYAVLGYGCEATGDTFYITAVDKNTRPEGSGWDLVSASGGTSFVYQQGDTIFHKKDVTSTLPAYKVLVGPMEEGTYWKDNSPYSYEYSIVGFEDLYSDIAGGTWGGCAKVKRIAQGDTKVKYFWWAPQVGRVKEAEYRSGQCQQGEELKRLEKSPDFP